MKHKTSELSGALLDAAVAKAEGVEVAQCRGGYLAYAESARIHAYSAKQYSPSADWAQGGPLIERERIQLMPVDAGGNFLGVRQERDGWLATSFCSPVNERGDTPLIAAMRAYVVSKLGDEVEL